jgi:biotin transport system substrate-specific component
MKTKDMVVVAMFAALISVLSQIAIPLPFSPVPVTLQTFAVVLTGAILGSRKGFLAMAVYTLMGAFGLPVFAQAKSGFPVIFGPSGGFIFGFIIAAYLIGKIIEKKEIQTYAGTLGAMAIGLVVIYTLGLLQLKFVLGLSFGKAFMVGVVPYLPLEVVKTLLGAYIGFAVRKAIVKVFPELVA